MSQESTNESPNGTCVRNRVGGMAIGSNEERYEKSQTKPPGMVKPKRVRTSKLKTNPWATSLQSNLSEGGCLNRSTAQMHLPKRWEWFTSMWSNAIKWRERGNKRAPESRMRSLRACSQQDGHPVRPDVKVWRDASQLVKYLEQHLQASSTTQATSLQLQIQRCHFHGLFLFQTGFPNSFR